jgi:hypothetical protein
MLVSSVDINRATTRSENILALPIIGECEPYPWLTKYNHVIYEHERDSVGRVLVHELLVNKRAVFLDSYEIVAHIAHNVFKAEIVLSIGTDGLVLRTGLQCADKDRLVEYLGLRIDV